MASDRERERAGKRQETSLCDYSLGPGKAACFGEEPEGGAMWGCSKLEQDEVFSSGSPLPRVEYHSLPLP